MGGGVRLCDAGDGSAALLCSTDRLQMMTIPLGAPSDEDKRMYELTQRSSGGVPRLETGEETQVGAG